MRVRVCLHVQVLETVCEREREKERKRERKEEGKLPLSILHGSKYKFIAIIRIASIVKKNHDTPPTSYSLVLTNKSVQVILKINLEKSWLSA